MKRASKYCASSFLFILRSAFYLIVQAIIQIKVDRAWNVKASKCVVKFVYVSPIVSHSPSLKPTLDGHFQNATVGFLLPIEEPITISFPLRVYAHNDSQNVSLVCPPLVSPPLCSLALSVFRSDPLYRCLSWSMSFSHFPPLGRIHVSYKWEGPNYRTRHSYFSRIIEICLSCNAGSCPQKCFRITRAHTHSHTGTCTFACESKQKGIWWSQQLVCPSVRVCVRTRVRPAVYRQHLRICH